MQFKIPVALLKSVIRGDMLPDAVADAIKYASDERAVSVDCNAFYPELLEKLAVAIEKDGFPGSKGSGIKIRSYLGFRKNPDGKRVGRLDALAAALEAYIGASPNKWLFSQGRDGHMLPHYVTSISYHPSTPDRAAYVEWTGMECSHEWVRGARFCGVCQCRDTRRLFWTGPSFKGCSW